MNDFKTFVNEVTNTYKKLDTTNINEIANIFLDLNYNYVTICGNGGSASVANHFATDFTKGGYEDIGIPCRVFSLCSNIELMTAIANDFHYAKVFSKQIEYLHHANEYGKLIKNQIMDENPIAIAVSSSGNSKNILEYIFECNERNHLTIAIVGFDGGDIKQRFYEPSQYHPNGAPKHLIHIPSNNYGVIEDISMNILHFFAQNLRSKYAKPGKKVIL